MSALSDVLVLRNKDDRASAVVEVFCGSFHQCRMNKRSAQISLQQEIFERRAIVKKA